MELIDENRSLDQIKEFSDNVFEQSKLDSNLATSGSNFFLTSCIVGASLISSNDVIGQSLKFTNTTENHIYITENYSKNIDSDLTRYISEINEFSQQNYTKHSIIKSVLSFKSLKESWDGYGALPLEVESASNTILLMDLIGENLFCRTTSFYPNPNGTISFEWENEEEEIVSLEIGNNSFSYFVEMASLDLQQFDNKLLNAQEANKLSEFIKAV